MGLFSKKKIYVASSIYNLSGDPIDRGNFLRSSVASVILDPNRGSRPIGRSILNAHMKGPAIKQRAFHRWAQKHFPLGCPTAQFVGGVDLDVFDFEPYVPVTPGNLVSVQEVRLENADFFVWAEQHILLNDPERLNEAWTCSYDESLNTITIQYEDLTEEVIPATNYVETGRYLYINYSEYAPGAPTTDWIGKLWIYRIGDGVLALDALDSSTEILPEYFPFIPIRMWNKGIDHEDYVDIFSDCAKAYKMFTQKDISELLAKIEENENVGDIDHAFMVFGVPLNTSDNAGRRYIYEFFKELIPYQTWSRPDYELWRNGVIVGSVGHLGVVGYKGPDGERNTLSLKTADPIAAPYDISISWSCIDERVFVGVGKEGARPGDVWLQQGRTLTAQRIIITWWDDEGRERWVLDPMEVDELDIIHQVDADTYTRIRVSGLVHTNMVYGGKSIEISPIEALADDEESGFFIPMHGPTLQKLPLVAGTQACVGNALLVLNCYKEVKVKWYQRGFFRILLAIVFAVISAFIFPGAGGLLGPHFLVGSSLGFSGVMATIAGSIVNTLAAVVMSSVLNAIGGIFEKLGMILSVVMSFMAGEMFSNLFSTGSFSFNIAEMFSASNLIRLTGAVGNGVQQWSQNEISDIQSQLVGLDNWFSEESENIENLTRELLGYSGALINPLQFTQLNQSGPRAESSDSFLARTLLTGHDIADVSLNVIENFAEISLQLPDYTT